MSNCKIDHSIEDVKLKLQDQKPLLPISLYDRIARFLSKHTPSQPELNDVFHLLKKYDLASESEQEDRNRLLFSILK
jgi:hypothetical protein